MAHSTDRTSKDFAALVNSCTEGTPSVIALDCAEPAYKAAEADLKTALSKACGEVKNTVVTWNAAAFDVEKEPVYALVSALSDGFKRKKKLRAVLAEFLAMLDSAGAGFLEDEADEQSGYDLISFSEVYAVVIKSLGRTFRKNRLVLVIEGLNDCEPKYAFKALRRAGLLLGACRAAIVLPVSVAALKIGMQKVYGAVDADSRIKDFIDVQCRLPEAACDAAGLLSGLLPKNVADEEYTFAEGFVSAVLLGASAKEAAATRRIAGIFFASMQHKDAAAACFAVLTAALKVRFPEAYALFADAKQYEDKGIFSQQTGALPGTLLAALDSAYGKKATGCIARCPHPLQSGSKQSTCSRYTARRKCSCSGTCSCVRCLSTSASSS